MPGTPFRRDAPMFRRIASTGAQPRALLAGALLALFLTGRTATSGAVTLVFSDKDSTPSSTAVVAGASFTFGVFLNESATTDDVTGLDYRFQASAPSAFRLTGRASTSAFVPYLSDTNPSVAPVTLTPTNGTTNLGGTTPDAAPDLKGVSSTEVADYTVLVLSGTAPGTYTVAFTGIGTGTGAGPGPGGGPALTLPTYSAGGPNYSTTAVASDNTFTVTVTASPEPSAGLALLGPSAALFSFARTRRRRIVVAPSRRPRLLLQSAACGRTNIPSTRRT